ncbi:serine/threonine protein kinase [Plasmodium inui San Antonio 1]|uniref:Serine/threonine protein kinase n=1 Tax=Plasmodium inui San Antonio 1 TaxID=1237626 RepID=W6ZWU7_9APIC|nr:serine/threonine protein kinase [Plasmodium inui San Antonio 1]EUD65272.1 serine/threonine protein kinase [Plasmodium inui San Antonio 1]
MFHQRCKSSEFLLGIQSYSLDEGKRKRIKKNDKAKSKGRGEVPSERTEKGDHQNKYSSIASKFEKVKTLSHPNVCSYFSLCRREDDFVLSSEYYSLSLYDLLREEEMDSVDLKCVRRALKGGGGRGVIRSEVVGGEVAVRGKHCSSLPYEGNTPRRKLIDAQTTKQIVQQILSAVHYLHSKEIKLLNLTLKDVLVTPKGEIKIHNYCLSYLFGNYFCRPPDRCDNFVRSLLRLPLPQTDTMTNVKGEEEEGEGKGGEKRRPTRMNIPRADNPFVSNALYFPPFFLLNDLANGKKRAPPNYDVLKHVDVFTVGIIILQLVNGIFHFDFLVTNCQPVCDESTSEKNPLLNEFHEIVGTLQGMRQQSEEASLPSGRRTDGDETSLYIDKPAEGEGMLEKVKTIFVFLLYTKVYQLLSDVSAAQEISLLGMNVYVLFRAFGKEHHQGSGKRSAKRSPKNNAKKSAHVNLLTYRVVKILIELLLNVKVTIRFVKWVEKILSEFFTLHVLKQNVEKIMYQGDTENEKIFFFNLLHKCLSLRGSEKNSSSSLLSHPYFYPRGSVPTWPGSTSVVMKQWGREQQQGRTPEQGKTASNFLPHSKEEKKFEATHYDHYKHYNPYVVEYVRSNLREDQLKSRHFIVTKDIHLWFDMLYKMDYFNELLYLNGVNNACSILRLPYIVYTKKKHFYELFFFRFYKLLLLGRYQGVLNVYSHLVRGNSNVRCSGRTGSFGCTDRKVKCRAELFTGGTCTNGYTFCVKGRRFLMGGKNKLGSITQAGVPFMRDKTSENNRLQTNVYPFDGVAVAKEEQRYRDVTPNHLGEVATHEEGTSHSFFFNIPTEAKYTSLPLRDSGAKRVLGVRLVEFYDALEDAYRLVHSKVESGGCDPVNNVTCVYEKDHSFLHQYSLHIKLQKLLTLDPLNSDELEKEVRRGFPAHMRGIAYLTLLGYKYYLLVRQAPGKKNKIRRLICEARLKEEGAELSVKQLGESPLVGGLTRETQQGNSSENSGSKRRIYHSSGNIDRSNDRDGGVGDAKEGTIHNHPFARDKSSLQYFLQKRRKYNDLVGSPQIGKRMLTVELLLKIKLGVRNKHLRSLLLPLCLLYYDSTYLCYKCSKRVVQNYLLDLYSSGKKWREFAYTFNCLLSYYAPELTLFFFKNDINVERVVYSWVCSLFSNFFDAQKFFWLLDRILTQPRCYLFFVCVSILIYLKRHIVMNMSRDNFYKNIFLLSRLVNLNFVLKTSMDMFTSSPMTQVQFPQVDSSLGEERNTQEGAKNPTNPAADRLENQRAHINYLPYLLGDANWVRYYVHKDTFTVYWKKGGSISPGRVNGNGARGGQAPSKGMTILTKKNGLVGRTNIKSLRGRASEAEKLTLQKLKLAKLKLKKIKSKKLNGDNWGESGDSASLLSPAVAQGDQREDTQRGKTKTRSVAHHCELFLRNYKINKKIKDLSEFSHYGTDVLTNYKCEDKKMGKKKKIKNKSSESKCVYYKLTKKNVKKRFKREDLVRLCNFPMFPFVYVTNLAKELSLDNYLIVDMRSPEEFKKKRLKHSVHVNTFLINFKKGVYINYTDGSDEVDTHLKTIILAFSRSIFDFDAIYNFLNLKIKRLTILWGGLDCAFSGLPASCFT